MDGPTAAPNAQGTLAKTPFSHLVLYLYQQRSTGTLMVAAADTEADAPLDSDSAVRVLFRRGRAIAAQFPGMVDSLEVGLLPLCALHQAPFAFYQGEDLVGTGNEVVTGLFDPQAFVAIAAHRYPRPDVVDGVLARYPGMRLRMQLGIDVERLRLAPAEVRLVEVMRAEPSDVETLCAHSELSLEDTRRLLYVLLVTKLALPYEERNPESFASHVRTRDSWATQPTASSTPPASQRGDSVVAKNPLMEAQAAPTSSKPPTMTRPPAWQALASIRAPGSKDSTHSLPAARPTSVTPRPISVPLEALDAQSKLRRIEQLFQRSAYDDALVIIRALVAEDRGSAGYQALFAYALLMKNPEGVAKEVVDAVNVALRLDEDEPRALYTKALAYKRMGREREAVHYFKRTVEVEPGHIDAARELRLLTMRATDDKKPRR